ESPPEAPESPQRRQTTDHLRAAPALIFPMADRQRGQRRDRVTGGEEDQAQVERERAYDVEDDQGMDEGGVQIAARAHLEAGDRLERNHESRLGQLAARERGAEVGQHPEEGQDDRADEEERQ